MERLSNLIAWSGLGARVSLIKGPLNINLQAYKKLNETLTSLAQAGKLFAKYTYTFNEWLFLVKKTFMHARFQVPPEDEGGVQILGLEESMVHPWKEIYLGGLVDGQFPQRLPQNIFLPEQTLETMGMRTLERVRLNAAYHFYRLLLSAEKVTLTYPENEGDRPVVPSPFLEELAPLRKAGLLNRDIAKTSGIQFSLKVEESRSIPELAKAISLAGNIKGLSEVLSSDIKGLSGIKSAIGHKPAEPTPAITPPAKKEFWVTELDAYLNCPYDYWIINVLGIEPLEEVTEDISPMDRGSKVHGILRDFYRAWEKPVTKENRDEARTLLLSLAEKTFRYEADSFRNRREKELFLTVMAERFLDAEEEFWKQGMRPAYLEQKIEHFKLTLSDGTEVMIEGKIDRIDVDDNGNFIIVDYKTGKYPLPKMNIEQDIFQLPVYAVMARQALLGKGPTLKKPIGLAYYDLKGKTGARARDVVLYDREARNDHPSSKPKASPKSAEEFEAILMQSMDKARKAVEGILAGDFSSTPQDENKCRYCPNEMMCEEKLSA
jgi:ATP-dependent helicase/nuclease subunit B